MANLSLAIPHDRWLHVFSEVRRVLTPGGRLELIDDKIFFPYDESHTKMPIYSSQPVPRPRPPDSSFDSDSDDDMNATDASSTLVDEPIVPTCPPLGASAGWQAHAENSKGLETIFEKMLLKQFDIHPRPQDAIDVVLGHVFGSEYANHIKTMHLALAPADHAEADKRSSIISVGGSSKGAKSAERSDDQVVGPDGSETNKGVVDEDAKPERPQRPHEALNLEPATISRKAANLLGISLSDQTIGESDHPIHIPDTIGARTMSRLRLRPSIVWKERWGGRARSRRASVESLHSEILEPISPKAAERLGISQADRVRRASQSSRSSQLIDSKAPNRLSQDVDQGTDATRPVGTKTSPLPGTAQSPGLILWPSTFIPFQPLELEMHACKNMHVLLGCKAALWDFIEGVKGADGKSYISEAEFEDLTWEYEW